MCQPGMQFSDKTFTNQQTHDLQTQPDYMYRLESNFNEHLPSSPLHLPSSHVWQQLLHEDPNMNKAVARLLFLMFLWGSREDRLAVSLWFTKKFHRIQSRKRDDNSVPTKLLQVLSKTVSEKKKKKTCKPL